MNKAQTVGKIGESIIKGLLNKYEIEFVDMENRKVEAEVFVNYVDKDGKRIKYQANRLIRTHPFDLIIGNKNIEIKTSMLNKNGYFSCSFKHNAVDLIDFVLLVVLDDKKEPLNYYLFERNFFSSKKGLTYSNKKFPSLQAKELVKLLVEKVSDTN